MSDMPDFENMSPEEAMRWMETLAKRQGADASGFLTDADAEVHDVDPDSVVDEPGYTPSEGKQPEQPAQPEPEPEPEPPAEPVSAEDLDFENMSPDEAMRWMETLAKRQGADASGFLTTADADIADTDPDTVVDEPGYTPFGEEKPAAAAPSEPEPQPEPEPAAEPADTDWLTGLASDLGAETDAPDFDDLDALTADLEGALGDTGGGDSDPMAWLEGLASSQPEPEPETEPELPTAEQDMGNVTNPLDEGVDPMAWLENLARNQGGKDEEMTTQNRMDIPTPSEEPQETAPGYQPYNVDDEGTSEPVLDASDPDNWLTSDDDEDEPAEASAEDWLAGLGDDEPASAPAGGWLAGLGEDEPAGEPAEDWLTDDSDTGDWLAGLTGEDATADQTDQEQEEEVLDGADPAAWLGELASDMDADEDGEEEEEEIEAAPGVRFDPTPAEEPSETGDPIADMLNRGETPSPEQMQAWMGNKMNEMINSEPLPLPDEEAEDSAPAFDPDAPPEPGELPDWLQDMAPTEDTGEADVPEGLDFFDMGEVDEAGEDVAADMPEGSVFDTAEQPAFTEEISTPDMPDMPDWLTEDIPQGGDSLADIFDTGEMDEEDEVTEEEPPKPDQDEVDTDLVRRLTPEGGAFEDDPWVQAIKEEQEYNYQTDTLPQWYEERIQDPTIREQFDAMQAEQLEEPSLPEEPQLPEGEREPIPNWLSTTSDAQQPPAAEEPETAVTDDTGEDEEEVPDWLREPFSEDTEAAQEVMPDWLADISAEQGEDDVPAWLTETLPDDDEEIILEEAPPEPAEPPQPTQPTKKPVPAQQEPASPVPVPAQAQIDVGAVLTEARAKRDRGDIDGALQEYERVVRANARLGTVVSAVTEITGSKEHKQNPAAYRVLGDALMRQGKLQAALDTYRKALNLL